MNVSGSIGELEAAYSGWLDRVPPEERAAVADIIEKSDLSTLNGINRLSQMMVIEMIRGNISPAVANAAKPWIELIIFNIQSMHQAAGTERGAAGVDMFAALGAIVAQMKPLQPKYVTRGELPEHVEIPSVPARETIKLTGSG